MDTINASRAIDSGLFVRSAIRDLQSDSTVLAALADRSLQFHRDQGETFLFVAGDRAAVHLSKDGTVSLRDVTRAVGNARGMIVMDVGAVFMRVPNRMGEDGRKLLDTDYGKEG